MNLKKLIFRFFLLILIFQFTISLVPIVDIRPDIITWIWVAGAVALSNLFIRNLLKFLTVRSNFPTIFLTTVIITTLVLYLLDLFIPGFDVNPGTIGPFDLQFMMVNSFSVNAITAKIFVAAVYSVFVAIMDLLGRSKQIEEEQ
jgi:hypothetical protein